jgi:hypothetical protein
MSQGSACMMRKLSIGLMGITLAACASKPPIDRFEAAWNEGQHNERDTVDGSRYMRNMVVWLGPALTESTAQCQKSPNHPEYRAARLVILLNLDGSVREAIVRPSNARWECVKDSLASKRFPAPPRDAFWTSGNIG